MVGDIVRLWGVDVGEVRSVLWSLLTREWQQVISDSLIHSELRELGINIVGSECRQTLYLFCELI